jgi:GWxTD domain-containing protein
VSKLFFIGFILLGFSSCYIALSPGSGNRNRNRNRNQIPPPKSNKPKPIEQNNEKLNARVKIFHLNADTSRIYFALDTRPQDYFLINDRTKYRAEYTLTYEVIKNENGKKIKTDTASLKLVDLQPSPAVKTIVAFVETNLSAQTQYTLKLSIGNMSKSAKFDYYLRFMNTKCEDVENYILTSTDGVPLLEKNFVYNQGKVLQSKKCDKPVELYKIVGGESYPTPPFADGNFASVNNYERQLVSIVPEGNGVFSFSNLEKGIYSLQTSATSGIVFYHFNKWYPKCSDTAKFYDPLVYICSKVEYEEFETAMNAKVQFENFWITKSGDKNYARKAINEYYKRVFDANLEYTSTCEGWRTDRGMVFIIFGKPSHVERQMNREIWFYKVEMNSTLAFTFNKVDNPYSENDYRLDRELKYKPQWYRAVENWRKGIPYNLAGN